MDEKLRLIFSDNLRQFLQLRGKTQADMAKYIGVSTATASDWCNGVKIPRTDKLQAIANWLHIDLDSLMKENGFKNFKERTRGFRIPVLGRVAAGIPLDAVQYIIDWEEIPESWTKTGEYFALQLHGDSMEPRMAEGDVVIVRKQPDVDSGDIAIVLVNGEDATCKRVMKNSAGVTLVGLNPSFTPLFYSNEDIKKLPVEIIGKVVELRAKF